MAPQTRSQQRSQNSLHSVRETTATKRRRSTATSTRRTPRVASRQSPRAAPLQAPRRSPSCERNVMRLGADIERRALEIESLRRRIEDLERNGRRKNRIIMQIERNSLQKNRAIDELKKNSLEKARAIDELNKKVDEMVTIIQSISRSKRGLLKRCWEGIYGLALELVGIRTSRQAALTILAILGWYFRRLPGSIMREYNKLFHPEISPGQSF